MGVNSLHKTRLFCAWVQHANHSATVSPPGWIGVLNSVTQCYCVRAGQVRGWVLRRVSGRGAVQRHVRRYVLHSQRQLHTRAQRLHAPVPGQRHYLLMMKFSLLLLFPRVTKTDYFYPRDAMLSQYAVAMARVSVHVCLCLSQVGVFSKLVDGSSWFSVRRLPSTYSTLCCKGIPAGIYRVHFLLELCLKLWT